MGHRTDSLALLVLKFHLQAGRLSVQAWQKRRALLLRALLLRVSAKGQRRP